MSERTASGSKGGQPASIAWELGGVDCQPNGSGQATLSAKFKVVTTSTEFIIDGPKVFVDDSESMQSPTLDDEDTVGTTTTRHYSWSDTVACGDTYNVKATVEVEQRVTLPLLEVEDDKACPECE